MDSKYKKYRELLELISERLDKQNARFLNKNMHRITNKLIDLSRYVQNVNV